MNHASFSEKVRQPGARLAGRLVSAALLLWLAVFSAGCSKLKARDELNKGVQAFKNTQYDVAAGHFLEAKQLDPSLMNARLYLATAYASQYIPGAPSEENIRRGQAAANEFKEVLEKDSNNLSAIDGLGSILFQMAGTPYDPKKFDESKTYHQRHIQLKPDDAEPYYWIGVINWTLAFRANNELRLAYNKDHIGKQIKETDPLPAAVRADYAAKYGPMVDEATDALKKAIELRPDYDDAMAYLNLLYRRKADMVESAEERAQFQKLADDLVDKVKEIKQRRAAQPSPTA